MSRQPADGNRGIAGGEEPLRVGVIGLGASWDRRYKPALLALTDHFSVLALYDPVQYRAEREARELGCMSARGLSELVDDAQIEALLLPDSQWFLLLPVEVACRLGKPVLCGPSLELEGARADGLVQRVRDSGLSVMVEMAPHLAPAGARLRQLLDSELGPPRLLLCDITEPEYRARLRVSNPEAGLLLGPSGVAIVDWLSQILAGEPIGYNAAGAPVADFVSLVLQFANKRAIHVRRYSCGARPGVSLRVVAEHGRATVHLPDRISWIAADGRNSQRLRARRCQTQTLLLAFAAAVRSKTVPQPNLEDAARALKWLRMGRQSLLEGRGIGEPNLSFH
jgi:predicted dehydrogenase